MTTNLEQAITCYREDLHIYTLDAFPIEYRQLQFDCAETQTLREDVTAGRSSLSLRPAITLHKR